MLKIFAFLLLMAISAESTSNLWIKAETSIVQMENNGKEDSKDDETEKKESKDKLFQQISTFQNKESIQSLFILGHIHFIYSAYLSLPEIPPELA